MTHYQLNLPGPQGEKEKFELAKDVSALANAAGGVLLLGVETTRDPTVHDDRAVALRPIADGMVIEQQIKDIIYSWVFPRLEVEVLPHAVKGESGQLWTISIERVMERDFPFIVVRAVYEDGRLVKNALAVFERSGSRNIPYSPQQLHSWINRGARASFDEPQTVGVQVERADDVLADDLAAVAFEEGTAYFYIQAAPARDAEITSFYPGINHSIHDVLVRPDYHLRDLGFNLPEGRVQRTRTGYLRVVWPQTESLSVTQGGLATAVEGQEVLTWGYARYSQDGEIWINPLALLEFTLDFWRFYTKHILPRVSDSTPLVWRVGLRNILEGHPLALPRSRVSQIDITIAAFMDRGRPTADAFDSEWFPATDREPGRLTFSCLSRVYREFGLDETLIPFARNGSVDEQEIANVK